MNPWWEACWLGLLQGLTEFLPVSSSGHLDALQLILDRETSLSLNVFLHAGTLLAVLVVFHRSFWTLARGALVGGEGRRTFWLVVLATLPAGFAGLFARDWIDVASDRWPFLIPACWLFTAGALWTLRRAPSGDEAARPMDARLALWIGCWQMLALLPGVSRSGITIVAAMWGRAGKDDAVSFSFLVATPLIAGATLLEIIEVCTSDVPFDLPLGACLTGVAVAFVSGWVALLVLLGFVRRNRLWWWSLYLVVAAAAFSSWLVTAGRA